MYKPKNCKTLLKRLSVKAFISSFSEHYFRPYSYSYSSMESLNQRMLLCHAFKVMLDLAYKKVSIIGNVYILYHEKKKLLLKKLIY